MLHILCLILKIIGIILLAILGILLFVVAVALLHPVRYRVAAKADGDIKSLSVEAKASWLLRMVSAFAVYKEQKFEWQVTLFGWKLNQPEKTKKCKKKEETPPNQEETVYEKRNANDSTLQEKPSAEEMTFEEAPVIKEQRQQKETKKEKKKKKKKVKTNQTWTQKIRCTIQKICDKIKAIWRVKEEIKKFLTDEVHLRAFAKAKGELIVLLKHFRPRRLKGYVRFGFEDPYNTGQVLAVLSVLYPFYGKHLEVYPEFEREILEGDVYIKGHIRLVHFLRIVRFIFFDRDIKQTYHHFKKIDFHI